MPGDLPKIYWDACVFISYINERVDRLADIDWFLEHSRKLHQIVTSTLTVAEVAFAEIEKTGHAPDSATVAKIDALWDSDDSPVILSEPHLEIMYAARDLAREALSRGWTIQGADSVHMATAKSLGVSEIHTYSLDWPRNAAILGIPIHPPICPTPSFPFPSKIPPETPLPDPDWITVDAWPALQEVWV